MLMKVKDWKIMENITGEIFPPEHADFVICFYMEFHWTRILLMFGKAAGISIKSAWLGDATNISPVEPFYLALYTIWVFVCVELCMFHTKTGQLGKSSAGDNRTFFLKRRKYQERTFRSLPNFRSERLRSIGRHSSRSFSSSPRQEQHGERRMS